ncbi:hypothetical protein BRADI_2g42471v3, partial [Brachypodium distachyon]
SRRRRRRGGEDVLWGDGVGSVADRVADRLPAVPLLPRARPPHGAPRRHPRPPPHTPLPLRLRHPHPANHHRLVRHRLLPPRRRRRVRYRQYSSPFIPSAHKRPLLASSSWFVQATAYQCAAFMLYVIERAKKCLDFAATLYIIHLFICIIYGGWPASITWWVVNIVSLAIMSLLGEYLCIRRELRDIPVSRIRASV